MTKIGLISDTHVPRSAEALPLSVTTVFQDVDLILHAGDLTKLDVLESLKDIAEVRAVHGNACSFATKRALPKLDSVVLEGWKIGLTHGVAIPFGYRRKMYKIAVNRDFDIIVCGHIHKPLVAEKNGVLIVNPGSPTVPLWGSRPTVAILELTRKERKVVFVKV